MENGCLMDFGTLPKIEDVRLAMSIARLQNSTDFRELRKWLITEVKEHLNDKVYSEYRNNELEIGAIRFILDLEQTFLTAHELAANLRAFEAKKKTANQ
jgi:hypothetical protein